jgi:hypothetical protein
MTGILVIYTEYMSKKSGSYQRYQTFSMKRFVLVTLAIFMTLGAGRTMAQSSSFNFDTPYTRVLGNNVETKDSPLGGTNERAVVQRSEVTKKVLEMAREKQREAEIKTKDGSTVRIMKEDNAQARMELEKGNLRLKYESSPSGVIKRVETKSGEPIEVSKNQLDRVEIMVKKELENNELEVSTNEDKTRFMKNGFEASTKYPISVGEAGRPLSISTPQGDREIKLSPDQIVKQLRINNQMASPAAGIVKEDVELKVLDGNPVYEVSGNRTRRFLGLFELSQPIQFVVSADTGEVMGTKQSFFANMISFLSAK